MNARPIIFSSAMVRALLAGRKTQTRRVIKPQPRSIYGPDDSNPALWTVLVSDGPNDGGVVKRCMRCPYGQIGEFIWVKETWTNGPNGPVYRATHTHPGTLQTDDELRWAPSIFMPRRASRITLRLHDVRVARVQDISQEDAVAEGVKSSVEFRELWNSINAKRGHDWESNCWVWVLAFDVVQKNVNEVCASEQ